MPMQALVIGFGGTGAHVLTALKELAVLKHGKTPESIKFLLFDTIADWEPGKGVPTQNGAAEEKIAQGTEAATSLDKYTEYFQLMDHDPDLKKYVFTHLNRDGEPERYPHLKDWLHATWLSEHVQQSRLNITEGAAQQRQIGRFAMFQNADKIIERLQTHISALSRVAGGTSVNVWVIGSSAGGTGAGCLLDAGYMTQLAAGNIDITLTGVIVLPEVYDGVAGISKARAYSLFRELNRVQEHGIPERDRYVEQNTVVSSKVFYDARKQNNSLVRKLFDDLFYLGKVRRGDEERKSFFASVANSIDPYLDVTSGPILLQASVNLTAVASSFGAARLYVPVETLADLFAWEQVESYVKRATAPRQENDRVINLYYGADVDRTFKAREKTENLLDLFGELLKRAEKSEAENRAWVQNSLDAEKIVTGWYQFAASSLAGENLSTAEAQAVMLAYINPYKSFTQSDNSKIETRELESKTYSENKSAGGVKESYDESRDRFAKRLQDLTSHYTNTGGGERTFAKGRQVVREKVSNRLRGKIDNLIIGEIRQNQRFSFDPANENQGTPLTRLYQEINLIVTGPMQQIDETISVFINTLNTEDAQRTQQPVNAVQDLRASKKSGILGFGNWVEPYQQAAREELTEYIRWYQKRELLKDMQDIVRSVRQHFERWRKTIGAVLDDLALSATESALVKANSDKLNPLKSRLRRASLNPTATISLNLGDDQMDGYVSELRRQATQTVGDEMLVDKLLNNSNWEAALTPQGLPSLKLMVRSSADEPENSYSDSEITEISQHLYEVFHTEIKKILQKTDIFDYIKYLRQQRGVEYKKIAETLSAAAEILLTAKGKDESQLVYSEPTTTEKQDIARLIQAELKELDSSTKDPEQHHSDSSSITLLRVKKPNLNEITNIDECEREYKQKLVQKKEDATSHDDLMDLLRAQVYHPFRAELEAWHIERHYWRKENRPIDKLMPARVVRLLENPEMIHAFAQAIATGAIAKEKHDWVWQDTRPVMLTNYEKDGANANLMAAAVTFILQQREVGTLHTITYQAAKQSIAAAVDKKKTENGNENKELEDFLLDFKENHLSSFVTTNLNTLTAEERKAFEMILDFYCTPSTRTGLQHRMDLDPT